MRRESPNRFSKVFKNSYNTIIYTFISLFYSFMIYIFFYFFLQILGLTRCGLDIYAPGEIDLLLARFTLVSDSGVKFVMGGGRGRRPTIERGHGGSHDSMT
jgi:hypothetical protein